MAKISYAQRIQNRIKEIEQQLEQLHSELSDLRVAERVIDRLGVDSSDDIGEKLHHPAASTSVTISDHIIMSLEAAGPMTVPELCDYVAKHYRPEMAFSSVGATLSRMRAKNLVDNQNGKWLVVQTAPPQKEQDFPDQSMSPEIRELI